MKAIAVVFTLWLLVGCGKVPPSQLQPGLAFFTDLDEVRFTLSRSFHDSIEISVRKPSRYYHRQAVTLTVIVHHAPKNRGTIPESTITEKEISPEIFAEVQSYVLRQDLIELSLRGTDPATDGSVWILEGRKAEFVIRHERLNPIYAQDAGLVAIGKRFLDLAGISIPSNELY